MCNQVLSPLNFGACMDKGTGQSVTSILKAPPGSSVVSPFSTLLVEYRSSVSTGSIETAERRIQSLLDINQAISLTSFDIIGAISHTHRHRILLQSMSSKFGLLLRLVFRKLHGLTLCSPLLPRMQLVAEHGHVLNALATFAGARQAFSVLCQVVSTVSQMSSVLYGAKVANDPDEPDLWQQDPGRLDISEKAYQSLAAFGTGGADGQVQQIDLLSTVRVHSGDATHLIADDFD